MLKLFLLVCGLVAPPDLPPAEDAGRFLYAPQDAQAQWEFAKAHCAHLCDKPAYGWAWRSEAEHLCECWNQLDNVKRHFAGKPQQIRESLARLRDLIGEEAYRAGVMPPPVPYWRFVDRD